MGFQKGQSGNIAGRPKGSKTLFSRIELELAIQDIEKEKKISLYKHLVRRAYENDAVLMSLVKKLLPDAQLVEEKEDWVKEELVFDFDSKSIPNRAEELKKYIY